METWLPIPDYPGYEASSLGRIRSYTYTRNRQRTALASEPRIKATYFNENGYEVVSLNHSVKKRAHVLVAAAFLGPKRGRMDVNHIDGNKANNRPDNLEYLSRGDNHRHAYKMGLTTTPFTKFVGVDHPKAKITERDVLAIRDQFASGVPRRDLATEFGLSYYTVWDITQRRSWTHI